MDDSSIVTELARVRGDVEVRGVSADEEHLQLAAGEAGLEGGERGARVDDQG